MPIVGDIERLLAGLYPNRAAIAVGLLVVVGALAALAWRRGWHRSVWRHPRAAVVAVGIFLAVALPVGWVLGSPLFIRSELVEPPPAAGAPTSTPGAVSTATPSPASSAGGVPESSAASASPSAAPAAPVVVLSGTFHGTDDFHTGSGKALVIEAPDGSRTLRFEDFSVRNGPDLYVYLSPSAEGYAAGALELGRLKATDGAFNYAIPGDAAIDAFGSAVVWCKAFSVQFASAPLSAP